MMGTLEDGASTDRGDQMMMDGIDDHNDAATSGDSGDESQLVSSDHKNLARRRRTQNAKFED